MEDLTQTIALSLGAGWASGINLYAAILVLGLLGTAGGMELPADLADIVTNPLVMLAAGVMYLVEFFTDKIPGVDTAWDSVHTFIRIPAGAILAASAVGDVGAGAEVAAGILGGGLSAASHAAKAGGRVLINTSPEPFTNWTASIAEDIGVVGGLLVALNHPILFIVLLAVFLLLLVWLLPKLWRGIKRVFGAITRLFGGGNGHAEGNSPGTDPPAALQGNSAGEKTGRPTDPP